MTWFRVGGAGIPATLKNAMNAVFNKKFGTTGQNYPPNGWPDDVNLLGPLPEKTVAGAIAHTDDAADTVPVKSVICSIVPKPAAVGTPSPTNPIDYSGYTGLNLVRAYLNLWNGFFESGWIDNSGADSPNADRSRSGYIQVKGGLFYYFICNLSWRIYYYDHDKTFISYIGTYTASRNITIPNNACYIRFAVIALEPTGVSLNYPSSDTESHTPTSVLSITDSWSSIGSIIGGERDLKLGTLKKTWNTSPLTLDGSEDWKKHSTIPSWFYLDNVLLDAFGDNTADDFMRCNRGTQIKYQNIAGATNGQFGFSALIRRFVFVNTDFTEVSDFKTWLSSNNVKVWYTLETSVDYSGLSTYDFETFYAVNNFFSDIVGGQTQVTYRQDIDLALQAVSSSRGLMMASRPVTQLVGEESDPDQLNELVEDDENDIREQMNEVVENDETEQEGEDDAR